MPQTTKSNGRKDPLDRFYTLEVTVKQCLQLLNLSKFDCIIEPSAGTGNFLKYLPSSTIGYDVDPQNESIIKSDWFTVDKTQFKSYKNILVCGNPPFGEQNVLAVRFFNEAAKIASTIAFILPLSFKKDSVKDKLDLCFTLVDELVLPNCEFTLLNQTTVEVPCVFQVWEKTSTKRKKKKLPTTSRLFTFTDKEHADFRIQRVGGNAGKASFDLNKAVSSNYFIKNNSNKTNEEFVEFVNSLTFPTITYTVGPKSLSKGELVSVVEEFWNKKMG